MLGDSIDNSRNGTKHDQARLNHCLQSFRGDRRGRRSGWGRKFADDPWLLVCIVLSGLAVCTTAAWLVLVIFHTPGRLLAILEAQGIDGLWAAIIAFWQGL